MALRDGGRWQDFHYSSEAEVEAQLREIDLACERFASIAGLEAEDAELAALAA